ncbi:MAG: 3-deoxy-7-phosphoheptulonate synthase class II, partial [Polyangiales bacterium]
MAQWTPDSFREKNATQQAAYPDEAALQRVLDEMSRLPPLVTHMEVDGLWEQLARAARGEAFVLQGGDCAESFEECLPSAIEAKLKILLQMSLVMVHATRKPVVRVGRIAGQYAKPRSADVERRGEVELPAYRGDLVNRLGFTREERTPDPTLLLRGYERAALTLNFIRALADGGFADLHHPENWDLGFAEHSAHAEEYRRVVESIKESISFMEAVAGVDEGALRRVDLFTSHEALALNYERAQTHYVEEHGWYDLSTHFPWIGMRTAQPGGAHVEFCRGLRNPIGVKVGPSMTPEWLEGLLETLDPEGEPGKLVLIHRLGHDRVTDVLPGLIETVQRVGKPICWISDPMHGNTEVTEQGIKTRRFDNILSELEQAFRLHSELGSVLGGVHFELTGEDVTECVGGARGLAEQDLQRAYRS